MFDDRSEHAIMEEFPLNLPELVRTKFNAARASGDLQFSHTEVAILHSKNAPFQLRFIASLAQKPKSDAQTGDKKPVDPFLDPPEQLLVTELPPSHILVLNKFAIVPEHFILATKEFKSQTDLLEEDDLESAYRCLKTWQQHGQKLFGFFNSGPHSGASQPHRHIQFLPVESMKEGLNNDEWSLLADNLHSGISPDIPFTYFSASISPDTTSKQLYTIYTSLHTDACRAVEAYAAEVFDARNSFFQGSPLSISYNLGLTESSIILCPRRSEGMQLPRNNAETPGYVALNGTVLAGTLLVKNKTDWDKLKTDESQLHAVLEAIGIPRTYSNVKL